jgi:Fur family ferric uptake transcriptional regulator
MSQLGQQLRDRGHRRTHARTLILAALESVSGHVAAAEIYQRIQDRAPHFHVFTVYRTLDLLEQEGLVVHAETRDGVIRWHRAEEAGYVHLHCERCGMDNDCDPLIGETFAAEVYRLHGFRPSSLHLLIPGVCRTCQSTAALITRGKP